MGWFGSQKTQSPNWLDAVRTTFRAVAATFVEDRLARFPGDSHPFQLALAHLTLGHLACEEMLNCIAHDTINADLHQPLIQGLAASPVRNVQIFFAVEQLRLVNVLWTTDADMTRGWPALMAEGACDLYAQDWRLVEKVLECVSERPESDRRQRFINCSRRVLGQELGVDMQVTNDRSLLSLVMDRYNNHVNLADGDEAKLIQFGQHLLQK